MKMKIKKIYKKIKKIYKKHGNFKLLDITLENPINVEYVDKIMDKLLKSNIKHGRSQFSWFSDEAEGDTYNFVIMPDEVFILSRCCSARIKSIYIKN